MSCHFMSRNTLSFLSLSSRNSDGPAARNNVGPTFTQRSPGNESTSDSAEPADGRSSATTISATGLPPRRDALRYPRVGHRRGTDADQRRACLQILPHVFESANSAYPDHGKTS